MARLYRMVSNPDYNERIEIFNQQRLKISAIFERHIQIHENGSSDYLPVIKELIVYMSKTFHEENVIMMNIQYPDFLEHAKAHQKFTEKIEAFLQSYKKGDIDLGFKIFVFLKDWIRDHTTNLDMECIKYLRHNAADLKEVTGEDSTIENYLLTNFLNK